MADHEPFGFGEDFLEKTLPSGEDAANPPLPPPDPGSRPRNALKALGPGLITGAADDDPSGIATYSSVGAQFGYRMLWTMPLIYPFMAAIQEISARLGRVTGKGIAGNVRRFYPAWMLYVIIGFLLIANIINIGADIGAMGAAVNPFSIAFSSPSPRSFWKFLFLTEFIHRSLNG